MTHFLCLSKTKSNKDKVEACGFADIFLLLSQIFILHLNVQKNIMNKYLVIVRIASSVCFMPNTKDSRKTRQSRQEEKRFEFYCYVICFFIFFRFFSLELHPQISHKLVSLFLFLHRILCAHFTPNTTSNNFIFNPIKWTIFSDYSSSYSFFYTFFVEESFKSVVWVKKRTVKSKNHITFHFQFSLETIWMRVCIRNDHKSHKQAFKIKKRGKDAWLNRKTKIKIC